MDTQNHATAQNRKAYQGTSLFTKHHSASNDSWQTELNNNVLVLGCSGSGKTRNHLKPNLMQCNGSYIVLDTKGTLYNEMGAYLALKGYQVDQLDFTTMGGTCGYDPLRQVRMEEDGTPNQQDMIAIATAICPREDQGSDPFWGTAAANYLTSYIAYVFEALPQHKWSLASVVELFEKGTAKINHLFRELETESPDSFAAALHNRASYTVVAERMHASIMGIIAANLLPFGFESALACYRRKRSVNFAKFGQEKRALFVTVSDLDRSLDALTSLFISQAFTRLCESADKDYAEHRLPVPVRFILDDFANLNLPNIDDVLAVVRSREISATIICQTVSQLEARYGEAAANSIIGNCDRQLVLAFQDVQTANYFKVRANRPASTLLETPAGKWWFFERGKRGLCDSAYRLEDHPEFPFLQAVQERKNQLSCEPEYDVEIDGAFLDKLTPEEERELEEELQDPTLWNWDAA